MLKTTTRIILAVATLIVSTSALGRPLALPDTDVRYLRSKVNGVEYKLYVSVPHDYAASKASYPVLYLLDADYSFPVARAIVQHSSDRKRLQPMILVGIAYGGPDAYRMNRTRDYTPTHTLEGGYGPRYQKVSGGGPKFLRFLREELIPWVDHHYRTKIGDRGLVGHSYGGLFTTWVLLTAPQTFNHYVIVSPSLWYQNRFMFDLEGKSRGAADLAAKVYFAVGSHEGNRDHDMVQDLQRMAKTLRERKLPSLEIRDQVLEDETHDSVFPNAVSRGIRFTFDGD